MEINMNETPNASTPADGDTESTPVTPAAPDGAAAELEQWKARFEAASQELEQFRQSQMTDQEKALAQARADGRRETLSELSPSLAEAEIRAQAAVAGVTVQTEALDLNHFLGEDGRPDTDRIARFVAKGDTVSAAPLRLPQLMGAGYHRGGRGGTASMDPDELVDHIHGGKIF
ncbi:hypothetical protein GO002_33035 [Streptomyces eurocidicus]|uniref:Phage minor structural protein n=1 Tax=Streptomyces eurocidicus TaxID=66423 RepID=A0A7W8F5X2_STREU|nr:hypothetical protein [Streptomyces eurocidicus]MBB5123257.1 hypothetical protein [Streptomyces eurocidicus]MBF6056639.1 hypothetical protein [Streptomyces eurocidicus]